MKGLSLKVLTVTAALGLCPLLLSAQVQTPPDAQPNSGDQMQIDPVVRAGTAHLNLDDATRARYRYHDGHWWFKTAQNGWLVEQNGQWVEFSPMTYTSQSPSATAQRTQNDNTGNAQTTGSGNYYYGTQYTSAGAHKPFSHHHFGGAQFGHWGTGYRGWSAH